MAKDQTNQFAEFVSSVVRSLPRDLDAITMQGWIENHEALEKVLREGLVPPISDHPTATFPITVDYSLTLAEMIKRGKYDWVNSDINQKNFPIKGSGKVKAEVILIHLNKVATTEEVLRELDRRNLRPAKLEELLAFGATFPEEQRKYPVIALGSVWQDSDDGRSVPDLGRLASERGLYLGWIEDDWGEVCRFVAVSK